MENKEPNATSAIVAMFSEHIMANTVIMAEVLNALMQQGIVGPRALKRFLTRIEGKYKPINGLEEFGINRVAISALREVLFRRGHGVAVQVGLQAQRQAPRRNWWEPNRPIRRRDVRRR